VIEDELRSLLTERADGVPDNPARSAEIHSRIRTFRRRRIAGTALGLVLLALASLLVLRLPGANESLPPGVPAPPYFDDIGRPAVPGYTAVSHTYDLTAPLEDIIPGRGDGYSRHLIVARCEKTGVGTVRNLAGPYVTVDCSRRVGDHFEGVAVVDPAQAKELLAEGPSKPYPSGLNVRVEPGSPGRWVVAILQSNAPESLPPWSDPGSRPLVEGPHTPDGTTVEITVPARGGVGVTVECVAGVRLDFSVPTGALGTADCDPTRTVLPALPDMLDGRVQIFLGANLARLGLRPGQRVPLTIRSVGRDTDQWRVYPIVP
jgi:hypothetical protein